MADELAPDHADGLRPTLVVVVPSITDDLAPWNELIAALKTLPGYSEQDCRWELMNHGARWYQRRRLADFAEDLAARIHERWVADDGYERVVLVGHSLGGLLVRQAYLNGLGSGDPRERRPWADRVERIVLFASLNRGFPVTAQRRWWLPLVGWMSRVLPGMRRWLVHDMLRGSLFITNLRITWIRAINEMPHPPIVVQFLGTKDKLVRAEDSRDIETFPTGIQERIPGATHADLIRLDATADPQARFRLIASAFTTPKEQVDIPEIGEPDQRVVLVLHGIRASNRTWARDITQHIESMWPESLAIAATYGRFSARKFAIPATRRKFLGWLQDTYAERLAANPKATFHFIGHSNGTYLLGYSLARIPAMRFGRVLLAGSVLPTSYEWKDRVDAGQVRHIRNDRAGRDVPVGVLCAALRGLGMRDIGTGGVDGFLGFDDPAKTEVAYYHGGHGAALTPANLPRLAGYVMDGTDIEPQDLTAQPPGGFALLSRTAPWLSRLMVLALAVGAIWFAAYGPWPVPANIAALAVGAFGLFVVLDLI